MSIRALVLTVCLLAVPVLGWAQSDGQHQASIASESKRLSLPDLVKQVSPGVVHLAALNRQGKPLRLGSGFVVAADGVILTAYHLVENAAALMIKTNDGEIYDRVEVLDYDIRRDLVALKLRPFAPLSPLRLAAEDQLTLGDDVAALGNPQGLENTVSSGILSGNRQAEGYRLIQTTAPISPGSSGGPLLNMAGEVIGLVTANLPGERNQNLNFAVPVAYIRPLLSNRNSPISVTEFSQRVAQSATTAALRGQPRSGSSSISPDSAWPVVHDHQNFTHYCVGELRIEAGELAFYSRQSDESLRFPWRSIREVRKNSMYGSGNMAFHIRLITGENYNFASITSDGQKRQPDALITAIEAAKNEALRRAGTE
jgi:S1-C subfamily serine protease